MGFMLRKEINIIMPQMAEREIIMTPKTNIIKIKMHEAVAITAEGVHITGNKPIYDLNGKVFASIKDCHKATGCAMSDISRTVQGKQKHTKGNVFYDAARFPEHFPIVMERLSFLTADNNTLKSENARLLSIIQHLEANPITAYPDDYAEYLEWKKEKEKKAELEAAKSAYAQTLREIDNHNIALKELTQRIAELESEIK